MTKRFYKVMLGKKSDLAEKCRVEGFIGTDFDVYEDLTGQLPDDWREFNQQWIEKLLPRKKSRVSAGMAAGALWVVSKGIRQGDIVLCPTTFPGELIAGEVIGDYEYVKEGPLPHRRRVRWFSGVIQRVSLSSDLRGGLGYGATVCTLDPYGQEILHVLGQQPILSPIQSTDPLIEDATAFALEKHLEDFLVANWAQTELGKTHDIFAEEGETVGQQYQSDTGPIDILAVSKDKKELLVIELKKGKASDNVVGQIQRYMGFVKDMLAEEGQNVRGIIIALEDDVRIRRALSVAQNIEFFRYELTFKLSKVSSS
jgi:restriction system protein